MLLLQDFVLDRDRRRETERDRERQREKERERARKSREPFINGPKASIFTSWSCSFEQAPRCGSLRFGGRATCNVGVPLKCPFQGLPGLDLGILPHGRLIRVQFPTPLPILLRWSFQLPEKNYQRHSAPARLSAGLGSSKGALTGHHVTQHSYKSKR